MAASMTLFVLMLVYQCRQFSSLNVCERMNDAGSNMKEVIKNNLIREKLAGLRRNADKALEGQPEPVRKEALGRLRSFVKHKFSKSNLDAFEKPDRATFFSLLDYTPANLFFGHMAKVADKELNSNIGSKFYKVFRKVQDTALEAITESGIPPFSMLGPLLGIGGPSNSDIIDEVNKNFDALSKNLQNGFADMSSQIQEGFQKVGNLVVNIANQQQKLIVTGFRRVEEGMKEIKDSLAKLEKSFKSTLERALNYKHAETCFFQKVDSALEDYTLMLENIRYKHNSTMYGHYRNRFLKLVCDVTGHNNPENALRCIKRHIIKKNILESIVDTADTEEAGKVEATRFGLSVVNSAIIAGQIQIQCLGMKTNSLKATQDCVLIENYVSRNKIFVSKVINKIISINSKSLFWEHAMVNPLENTRWPLDTKQFVDVSTFWTEDRPQYQEDMITVFGIYFNINYDDPQLSLLQGPKTFGPFTAAYSVPSGDWMEALYCGSYFYFLMGARIGGWKHRIKWALPSQNHTLHLERYHNVLVPSVSSKYGQSDKLSSFTPCMKFNRNCDDLESSEKENKVVCYNNHAARNKFITTRLGISIGQHCCHAYHIDKKKWGVKGDMSEYSVKLCDVSKQDSDKDYKWMYFRYEKEKF